MVFSCVPVLLDASFPSPPGSGNDINSLLLTFVFRLLAQDSQCFSLVIGEEGSMLDLIAPNAEQRDLWVAGIQECRSRLESRLTNPEEAVQLYPIRVLFQTACEYS